MPQFTLPNLESPLSGEELINDNLEPWRDALHSTHSGSDRPDYVAAGMLWLDTTTNPWILNVFDGAQDIALFEIDTSANTAAASGINASAFIQTLLDDANASTARATLGLVIGADVQAYNTVLNLLAGLTGAANKGIYFTGGSSMATFDLTAAGRALLDDADAAAQRTTLGLGTAAVLDVGTGANNIPQLDGSSRLPAVDGSQLTNLPSDGVTIFDGTLSNASTQDFTWTAGAYRRVEGYLTNAAQSGSSAVTTNFLIRLIDNGTVKSGNGDYQTAGYVNGVRTGTYESRTNAFCIMDTEGTPASNAQGLNIDFKISHLNDWPMLIADFNNILYSNNEGSMNGIYIDSNMTNCSGIQLLLSSGSRAFSTSTKFVLKGYP